MSQISIIHEDLSRCPRLRTLRLEENCLALAAIPSSLLRCLLHSPAPVT